MKNIFRISGVILVILSIFLIHSCEEKPTPPVISTTVVTAISYTTATSGGAVINEGGAPVTAKGVCWNTSPDPTTANNKTTDGTGTGSFNSSLTGLIAGTTYYVRAYATNTAGIGYGNQVTFTTSQIALATLTTTAITSITQTTAVTGGNIITDNGSSVTARGVCWGTVTNPTTANNKTTDGTGTGSFVSNLISLQPGTIYYVRSYATNSIGTSYGNEISFTTLATVPTLITTAATSITGTSAISGGNISTDGGAAVTDRGVCWSTSLDPTTALSTKTTDGTGTGSFTSSLTNLSANTTYYVRAYATNSVGTAYGTQVTFTTGQTTTLPTVTTNSITNITQTTASGGGDVTSDGNATVTARGVCWSTSTNPTISLSTKTTDGTGTDSFTSSLTNLSANTTYYVRAYATNSVGTAYGTQVSFTTSAVAPVVPTLTTTAASSITSTTATSGGNITSDGGASVTARGVCWSTSANPAISLSTKTTDGSGTGSFTSSLTGLTANTTYYVRAYAINSVGTAYGTQVTFTTGQTTTLPTVTTNSITNITQTTATGGGDVTSDGNSTVTARGVCWSTSTNPTISLSTKTTDGTGTGAFTSSLTGLTANTSYYVRAYATNSAGTAYGTQVSFTTSAVAPVVPTLTTTTASSITSTTATSGGTITSDGGASVTARGVCWSTSADPTIALSTKTTDGTGTGSFTSSLTGLTANTTYYVRAYATNSVGTAYGTQVSFTTSSVAPVVPTLTTTAAFSITGTTATSGGNITSDGGASVTARGVCWSTSTNPTISLSTKTTDGTGTGSFTSFLTGLTANTTYYVRAYATNSVGTAYGTQVSFTTLQVSGSTVTDIEGNVYNIVTIGTQVWMKENLKTIKYNDGTTIPLVTVNSAWAALITPGYCWYNNDAATYKASYGALYNGYTVNTGKLCPTGWHVPGDAEWTTLTTYLGGESVAGGKLKETGTTHWWGPNTGATNESGFTALPGGYRLGDGFNYVGGGGVWWSSTEGYTYSAWGRYMGYDYSNVGSYDYIKPSGFSVRCLKDGNQGTAVLPVLTTTTVTAIASTTATSGGNITSDGGASVTARGVCWSTSTNPTISLSTKTTDGTGTGAFTSSLTGLTASTIYYVRAYATNSIGTAYGAQVSFTTSAIVPVVPTLTTTAVTTITQTTATSGGNISSDGGASVTARGVCWSTSTNPTISLSTKTTDGTGTGAFTSSLTGLTANTSYYVRAFATNSVGTAYGTQVTFTTGQTTTLPTVTTNSITNITQTTATGGGDVTSDGNATVTARGVCWSTSANPTTTLSTKTTDGTGTGAFTSSLTGLTASTTYYVRAYTTNSVGTAYGTQVSFTTSAIVPVVPTLTTTAASSITNTTATSGGNISNDGGATVTARGVCWSTSQNPTIALSTKTTDGTGAGIFTSSITGLIANTFYYVRAYATNSAGTSYGADVTFTTPIVIVPPSVTTGTTTATSSTMATSGGNVTSDGGATVTARGVCWSTSLSPTVALSTKTSDGTGTGTFTSNITGLTASTTYYVRAYATNSVGTAYGTHVSFTTSAVAAPTLSTTASSSITSTTATSGGNITSDGGASVTSRGVCWSTSTNLTISLSTKTTDGTGTGAFTSSLTGLTANTYYYVRAYATNSAGTSYGDQISFKTQLVSDVDGNTYTTVIIGSQVWMRENLKTIKYNDGTAIPLVTVNSAWAALITPGYCLYNNDAATYKATYGALYNWYTVNTGKLCPTGWHVPGDAEWTTLTTYLGGESVAGGKLKEAGTSHWFSPNTAATNTTVFTALPGGFRYYNGPFDVIGSHGFWWSSTEGSTSYAWFRSMSDNFSDVYRSYDYKQYGFSVRCLRDY